MQAINKKMRLRRRTLWWRRGGAGLRAGAPRFGTIHASLVSSNLV